MSHTERGIYITLLSMCWLETSLPLETDALAKLVGMPLKRFTNLWENTPLKRCFQLQADGRLHHKRLDEERSKQAAYNEKQQANGAKGGRPRKSPLQPNDEQFFESTEEIDPNLETENESLPPSPVQYTRVKQAQNSVIGKGLGFSGFAESKPKKSSSSSSSFASSTAVVRTSAEVNSAPPPAGVLVFPVVGSETPWWPLTEAHLTEWSSLFPSLDVLAEARKALAWILANPGRRKTPHGMKRFLAAWLTRTVDRAPVPASAVSTPQNKRIAGAVAGTQAFLNRRQG